MARLLAALVGSLLLGAPAFAQVERGGLGLIGTQLPPRDVAQVKPGTATLRGRVSAADSGQPLRRAQVNIFPGPTPGGAVASRPVSRNATTDNDGRYEFTG